MDCAKKYLETLAEQIDECESVEAVHLLQDEAYAAQKQFNGLCFAVEDTATEFYGELSRDIEDLQSLIKSAVEKADVKIEEIEQQDRDDKEYGTYEEQAARVVRF